MNLSDKGLFLALGALICVLLASALLAFQNTRQLRNDAAWVTRSHQVLEALQGTLGAVTDAETGQRGYLITGDRGYLEPYRSGASQARLDQERVRDLVRDNPPQAARAGQLGQALETKLAELDRTLALQDRDPAAARREVRTHLGASIMDAIRAQVAAMTREEQDLLAARERRAAMGYGIALASGALFGLLGLAAATGLLVQLRRNFRQRDQWEAMLRENEERFRTAFERGGIPMAISALDGTFLRANQAFGQMLGYSEAELAERSAWDVTHPEDLAQTRQGLERVSRGEAAGFRLEKRYLRKDGTVIWGDMCTACVPDGQGRPGYLLTHIQDITERKRAEDGLRLANQRKDEFMATLAHELRNPLAPIRTGAFLLGQRAPADPEARQIYDMIARQSAHMARLVDDLLDIARIERGRVELRPERVDLGAVVAHALEASRALIEAGGHRVSVELPTPAPELEADPVRLEQMLCNLLNNACKYTPAGGRIQVSAAREDSMVVLRVRDDGVGLAPEEIPHLFDLFYQAGPGAQRREGGLGIGLTLVQRLAMLHGGEAAAASEGPGRGSEFLIRLPAPAQAAPRPEPAAVPAPAGAHRHVLVVDDDPSVRQTLEMLLRATGYQVSAAATGLRGVELALASRPDLALIDLGMPGMDGLVVAARIRAELGPAIRLVALTGFSRESDVADTRAAGFDRHLVKSGDPRELLKLLEEMG